MTPLISVVVPVHNRAALLKRALESVHAQSWKRWELIVVDDGSTDASLEVAERFTVDCGRVVRLPLRSGAPGARNAGISVASGEFIALLDCDDAWHPDKLTQQMLSLVGRTKAFALCEFTAIRDHVALRGSVRPGALTDWSLERVLALQAGPVSCSLFLLPREAFAGGIRFDPALPALQDLDLLAQLARDGWVAVGPTGPLVQKYSESGRDRVFNPRNEIAARRLLLAKYSAELAVAPASAARQLRALSLAYNRMGEFELALDATRQAVQLTGRRRERILAATGRRPRLQAYGLRIVRELEDGLGTNRLRRRRR